MEEPSALHEYTEDDLQSYIDSVDFLEFMTELHLQKPSFVPILAVRHLSLKTPRQGVS